MYSPRLPSERSSVTILMADDDEDDRVLTAGALKRSRLWDPANHRDRKTFPSHGRIIAEQTKVVSVQDSEAYVEQSYRERLY